MHWSSGILFESLWLHREAIIAAFEVEHSTAIYSG